MSLLASLPAIESELRRTVSEGGFRQTPELLERYMRELASAVRRVPPGGSSSQALEARARALMDWVGTMASVSRAHYAAELEHLPNVAAFGNPEPRQAQSFIDA